MANRHSHKKLRAEIRARMAARGESYQTARQRIQTAQQRILSCQTAQQRIVGHRRARAEAPDLIAASYFGVPITVAAFELLSHLRLILVTGCGGPLGLPWGEPSMLHVRTDGVQ